MTLFEDFERGVGTYLKVVGHASGDALLLLYLRPEARFLFLGYWCGYERSGAAGYWLRRGSEILLEGRGHVSTDALPGPGGRRLERVFKVETQNHTPILTAASQLEGWSLLSWAGPLAYIGQRTVIDPDGKWLPESIPAVDTWIEKVFPGQN